MKHRDLVVRLLGEWQDNIKSKVKFHIANFSTPCGTVKCAIGYLSSKVEFIDLGFRLVTLKTCLNIPNSNLMPYYNGDFSRDAVSKFFEINLATVEHLFYPEGYHIPNVLIDGNNITYAPTLQEVIDRVKQQEATI